MPKKDNKILKYNHGDKSMKVLFINYADLEYLLEKIQTCNNNPKKLSTTKIIKHTIIHCLKIVHLMLQKTSLIVIEVKTV